MSAAQLFLFGTRLWELVQGRLAKKYIQQYKPFPIPPKEARLFNPSDAVVSWLANVPHQDAVWNSDNTLLHLLAPFQEPDIGLVGCQIEPYVPKERQSASKITEWEVAALYSRLKQRGGNKAAYVADGSTNFIVSGATMLLRGVISREPDFQNELLLETFRGFLQTAGEDAFITRWVLFQHLRKDAQRSFKKWRIGMQILPEAYISAPLARDSRFVGQVAGFGRDFKLSLTCLFSEPGFRKLYWTTPYMARKMVQGLLNPFVSLLWYISLYMAYYQYPIIAVAFALYYLYGFIGSMFSFVKEFPYCGSKIWAAILSDMILLFSAFYFDENSASRPGFIGDRQI
ncbi:hypothetical protein ONZ43_g5360 [Nemania bipapillata]|uniref:Uncharacterized protein n=1 Tax=Nemania bipapillata TaxID=110536 RepID=A0ACC2IBT3_9PEZI|nr:hypothetical protein ONZ43_g5360 [Nemania bipapillata]